jgi:hypothetical protein
MGLKSGRRPRDPMKSDSRHATNVSVPFHSSFYCTHHFPDKPVILSESSPLLSQNMFMLIFCAPINNRIKTTIPSKPGFLPVSSSLPSSDLLTRLGLVPHSFPFSARMLLTRDLPGRSSFQPFLAERLAVCGRWVFLWEDIQICQSWSDGCPQVIVRYHVWLKKWRGTCDNGSAKRH